jgi:hypothetical protein
VLVPAEFLQPGFLLAAAKLGGGHAKQVPGDDSLRPV